MDNHIRKLRKLCRVCGIYIDIGKARYAPKTKYLDEFKHLYHVDVSSEDEAVYPPNVCHPHTSMLLRIRRGLASGKTSSTNAALQLFTPHSSESCHICDGDFSNSTRANISKHPKYSGPGQGRGVRGTIVVTPAPVSESSVTDCEPSIEDFEQSDRNSGHDNEFIASFKGLSTDSRKSALRQLVGLLGREECALLAKMLASKASAQVKVDIQSLSHINSDLKTMAQLDLRDYVMKRDKTVLAFLSGFMKTEIAISSDKSVLQLINIVENMYNLSNNRFLGPFSQLQNLTVLSLTNSKLVANIVGSVSAGGKYTHLSSLLNSGTNKHLECPSGDIVIMFDNEQVVGKSWTVRPNNKVKVSIVTNVAAMSLDPSGTLQQNATISPGAWFKVAGNEKKITELVTEKCAEEHGVCNEECVQSQKFGKYKEIHNEELNIFIQAAIEQVLEDKNYDRVTETYTDNVDGEVKKRHENEFFKKCPGCATLVQKSKRKCPECQQSLTKKHIASMLPDSSESENTATQRNLPEFEDIADRTKTGSAKKNIITGQYDHVPNNHQTSHIPVKLVDPVFVNPNSPESLRLVLRHIGKEAGVHRYGGKAHAWVIVVCDGLPYTMILKLIQEQMICAVCSQSMHGHEAFKRHCTEHHRDTHVDDVLCAHEFDWVLLRAGDGHYEMNLMKGFMGLNWRICMSELAKEMGWTSESAQNAALNCYDNHKTWQLIAVFHFGTLLELLHPYVIQCLREEKKPTPQEFVYYAKRSEDPNFRFMFEMVSRYSQGIFNYRMGIRRNNSLLVQSAKHMTKEIFHGRRHPKYQEIEMVETFQRYVMPSEVREFCDKHESVSKYGNPSTGQGFDFVLEEENKAIKSWIKHGVPSDQTWLSVIRNSDTLKTIRNNLLLYLGLNTEQSFSRNLDLDDAISAWRAKLRQTGYLANQSVIHKSVSGVDLDPALSQFTTSAARKRSYRMLQRFLGQDPPEDPALNHPVYVTPDEREHHTSLNNQTIEQIDSLILDAINSLSDSEVKYYYCEAFQKNVLRKKKDVHLAFLAEVFEAVQMCQMGGAWQVADDNP